MLARALRCIRISAVFRNCSLLPVWSPCWWVLSTYLIGCGDTLFTLPTMSEYSVGSFESTMMTPSLVTLTATLPPVAAPSYPGITNSPSASFMIAVE